MGSAASHEAARDPQQPEAAGAGAGAQQLAAFGAGAQHEAAAGVGTQHPPSPDFTRFAASPYFSRTTSLIVSGAVMAFSFRQARILRGSQAPLLVQHSA